MSTSNDGGHIGGTKSFFFYMKVTTLGIRILLLLKKDTIVILKLRNIGIAYCSYFICTFLD